MRKAASAFWSASPPSCTDAEATQRSRVQGGTGILECAPRYVAPMPGQPRDLDCTAASVYWNAHPVLLRRCQHRVAIPTTRRRRRAEVLMLFYCTAAMTMTRAPRPYRESRSGPVRRIGTRTDGGRTRTQRRETGRHRAGERGGPSATQTKQSTYKSICACILSYAPQTLYNNTTATTINVMMEFLQMVI
jgi:hypothetical protein